MVQEGMPWFGKIETRLSFRPDVGLAKKKQQRQNKIYSTNFKKKKRLKMNVKQKGYTSIKEKKLFPPASHKRKTAFKRTLNNM